jgi:hypothetical protein
MMSWSAMLLKEIENGRKGACINPVLSQRGLFIYGNRRATRNLRDLPLHIRVRVTLTIYRCKIHFRGDYAISDYGLNFLTVIDECQTVDTNGQGLPL